MIWPDINHHRQMFPGGNEDIAIPALPPDGQILVSYLYFRPRTFAQVNAGIDCDQGGVQQIPVLLQRQLPTWVRRVALLYAAYRLAQYAAARLF